MGSDFFQFVFLVNVLQRRQFPDGFGSAAFLKTSPFSPDRLLSASAMNCLICFESYFGELSAHRKPTLTGGAAVRGIF